MIGKMDQEDTKRTPEPDGVLRIVSGHTKSIDSKKRTVRAVLSSETVDRYGDVILASSFNNQRNRENYFEGNPIVLWAHGRDSSFGQMPVGKQLNPTFNERDTGGELAYTGDVVFTDAFQGAEDVWQLYNKEVMRAFSVGFRPITVDQKPQKEGQTGLTFKEVDLLENSAVPIPANPKAMRKAFAEGFVSEEFLVKTFFPMRDYLAKNSDIFVPQNWSYKASINDLALMANEMQSTGRSIEIPPIFIRKKETLGEPFKKSLRKKLKNKLYAVLDEFIEDDREEAKQEELTPTAPSRGVAELAKEPFKCEFCGVESYIVVSLFPEKKYKDYTYNNVECPNCKTTVEQCFEAIEFLATKS